MINLFTLLSLSWRIIKLLILLGVLCFRFNLATAGNNRDVSYLIRPDGIGLFKKAEVTYAEARSLYPRAVISVELGNPGKIWLKNSIDNSKNYYFVFRQDGDELFRAECNCLLLSNNDWIPIYAKHYLDKTQIIIMPIAMHPRFHTDRGISVGSTIKDLRRAYPELGALYAVHQGPSSSAPQESEFVCFGGGIANKSANAMRNVNFYVRPAAGKKRVGKYSNFDYTNVIDSRGIIVGIAPHGGCLINAVPPD